MFDKTIASWVNGAVFVSFFNAERSIGFGMYCGSQDIVLTDELRNSDNCTTIEQWKERVGQLAREFMQTNPRNMRSGSRA